MSIEIIVRDKGKIYRAVVRRGGQKLSKCFVRKADAEIWEHKNALLKDQPISVVKPADSESEQRGLLPVQPMTFDELREEYRKNYSIPRHSPSTQKLGDIIYRTRIKPYIGNAKVCDITPRKLENYFLHLSKEFEMAPAYINKIRNQICGIFSFAVGWGFSPVNPVHKIKPLPQKNYFKDEELSYLTQVEIRSLLSWTKQNDRWLYPKLAVLTNTGLRFGELIALRPRDLIVDERGGRLTVSRSYCYHTHQIRERTKGGNARVLPISSQLAEAIRTVAERKGPEELLLWDKDESIRFPTKFRKRFVKALRFAETKRVRIHDLRHTFAVHFLENGGHIYDLQKLLGHQSIKMTERYSHFSNLMTERSRGVVNHLA